MWTWIVALLAALLIVGACTAAPPSPPAAPPQPAAQATNPTAPADDWNAVLAAARREGRLNLIGPQGSELREALTQPFSKVHPGIEVYFTVLSGSQVTPRVTAEQGAGQFLTDVIIVGAGTVVSGLMPANATVPIEPWLVGPNARDRSAWRGGDYEIADRTSRHNLVFGGYAQLAFIYSPAAVNPAEFRSWRDLLDPKWKGKIAMGNPRSGAASAHVIWWYHDPGLGKEYLRDLLVGQQVMISHDDQQLVNWAARGQYPIVIGASNTLVAEAVTRGLPVAMFDGGAMAEGTYLSAGNGTVSVMRNAPHPNAAKVYLDWLLSRDAQYEWSKTQNLPSLRRDVPTDHIPPYIVAKEGVQYHPGYGEDYAKRGDEAFTYVGTLVGQ
jgi:iron(III) transport system substrate-binding protein